MAFIASQIHKWVYIWTFCGVRACVSECVCVCMCRLLVSTPQHQQQYQRQQHNDNDIDDDNGNSNNDDDDDDDDNDASDNKSDRNDKYLGLNCIAKIHRESRLKFTTKRLFVTLNMGSIRFIIYFPSAITKAFLFLGRSQTKIKL